MGVAEHEGWRSTMVHQSLLGFFQSSVEAGGALIGLLFVAVTIAPKQSLMHALQGVG
jgi:hypothetical protein